MNSKKLLAQWGLKWNPFSPELPGDGLLVTPKIENFAWRVQTSSSPGGRLRVVTDDRVPASRWRCGSSPGGLRCCGTSRSV